MDKTGDLAHTHTHSIYKLRNHMQVSNVYKLVELVIIKTELFLNERIYIL